MLKIIPIITKKLSIILQCSTFLLVFFQSNLDKIHHDSFNVLNDFFPVFNHAQLNTSRCLFGANYPNRFVNKPLSLTCTIFHFILISFLNYSLKQ